MSARDIPSDIQRQVRQQSGFGCAICGRIGTDYEHIVPYADVKGHTADNIVLLCGNHHNEVTRGRLPKSKVAEAKKTPFALIAGRSAYYQYEAAAQKSFAIGGDIVLVNGCERFHVLVFRSTPLVTIELDEGVPLLSMRLENGRGETVLHVKRNRILLNAHNIWDVDLRGTRFIVRRKRGDILLRIDLVGGEIHLSRLKIAVAEVNFSFKENGTRVQFGIEGVRGNEIETFGNVTNAGREFAMFRVGKPAPGERKISANWGIDLPGENED